MSRIAEAIVKISSSDLAFFLANRLTIPTNQGFQEVIRGENTGIAREVVALFGDLRRQSFKEFASGHRHRSGAFAPTPFEGMDTRPRNESRLLEIGPRAR
jgi:hypothetical protein